MDAAGKPFSHTKLDPAAKQPGTISYTFPDGTLFMREDRTYNGAGKRVARTFTRYTESGETTYADAGELYRAWFDEIRGDRPSYLIVDSKYSATHFAHYERNDTYKFHVLHGYHSVGAGHAITAPLTPQRKPVLTKQERWDGIIALTERNKEDLETRFGTTNNRFVVSNIVTRVEKLPPFRHRDHKRGVMVARLSPVKDIPLAMRIMKRVQAKDPRVTLDVYGGGPEHQKLLALRTKLGLDDIVTFHGAVPGAAKHFDTAAFTLLTSESEMQPLVLMEAMGRGCPPVAHDIRYGPRDLIKDGRTGFIVEPQDETGAAQKVLAITSNRFLAKKLSRRAWRAADNFGERAALVQWADAIATATANRSQRILPGNLSVGPAYLTQQGLNLRLELAIETALLVGSVDELEYSLVWMNRSSGSQQSIKAERQGDTIRVSNAFPVGLDPFENNEPFDAYLQVSGHNLSRRIRVPIDVDHAEVQFNSRTSYRTVNGYWSMRK